MRRHPTAPVNVARITDSQRGFRSLSSRQRSSPLLREESHKSGLLKIVTRFPNRNLKRDS
jgi:hypothetical protein